MNRSAIFLVFTLLCVSLFAQPWQMDNAIFNPSGIPSFTFSQPRFNDVDGDGDADIWLGNTNRSPLFIENIGSSTNADYTIGTDHLQGISSLKSEMAISADLNGDGIPDLITGGYSGLFYFVGEEGVAPLYTEQPGFFDNLNLGHYPVPDLADVDGDGDLDLLVGFSESGEVRLYKNTGSPTEPSFDPSQMTSLIDVGLYAYPVFCDFDSDGDFDIFIGRDLHGFVYLQNNGSPTEPLWETNNSLFAGLGMATYWNSGDLADLSGNGLYDLVFGTADGPLICYMNTGSAEEPIWQENTDLFGGTIDVGGASSPFFIDFDGDGDMDMLVATQMGYIKYFRNVGDIYSPAWEEDSDYFSGIDHSIYAAVTAADVTDNGFPDLIVGDLSGQLFYYTNNGTQLSHNSFMFMGVTVGGWSCPRFVDMDFDGDMDLAVGNEDGNIIYFENTGSPSAPSWSLVDGYFGGIDVGSSCSMTFADLTGDGNLEIVAGNSWGDVYCYVNSGFGWTLDNSLVESIVTDQNAAPALVDLDHDGDFDIVLGDYDGTLKFFRNENYSAAALYPPQDIDVFYDNGEYVITWEAPIDGSTSPFMHYNVYLDEVLIDATEEQLWILDTHSDELRIVSVSAQYIAGESEEVSIEITPVSDEDLVQMPIQLQNYPNPFNPSTTISFMLESPKDAKLEVYNLKGQKLRSWEDLKPGANKVIWDGRDSKGRLQSSGVYLFRLRTSGKSYSGKMIMLK